MRELSSEQASGSLKSWLVSLENRAGALSCEEGEGGLDACVARCCNGSLRPFNASKLRCALTLCELIQ